MTMIHKQALFHMGKALDLLDLGTVCPASCFLQMAIDLVKEDIAIEPPSPSSYFDPAVGSAMPHDIGVTE